MTPRSPRAPSGGTWRGLLAEPEEVVLLWLGGRSAAGATRAFRVPGALPPEHGFWRFRVTGGRDATLVPEQTQAEPLPDAVREGAPALRGYLVGDRLVPDAARVDPDPRRLVAATRRVHLVEPGLGRFARAQVVEVRGARGDAPALVYAGPELPLGPEDRVEAAWLERRTSLSDIAGVTPALELAFRWLVHERARAEARREAALAAHAARLREAEEARRRDELAQTFGTGATRRALAAYDFEAAARAALALSGAELLDQRPAAARDEVVVSYRFRGLRLQCVVTRHTLQVTDAGVCLSDHATGERGDGYFTLESLPGVIAEALDQDALVVWRHGV